MQRSRKIFLEGTKIPVEWRDRLVLECAVDFLGNVYVLFKDTESESLGPQIGRIDKCGEFVASR